MKTLLTAFLMTSLIGGAAVHAAPITEESNIKRAPAQPRSFAQAVLDAIAEGDAKAAFAAATQGRAKGEAACIYLLGQMHEQGRGVAKPDAAKAFSLYEEAAKKGVPEALTAVARCLEQGIGAKADLKRALAFWQKAAEAGDPPALGRMALAEFEGHERTIDHKAAREWAEKAVKTRDPMGLWVLSQIHEHGLGGATPNLSSAVELCMQAAQAGHTFAMHQMGRYYAAGKGLTRDPVAAAGWYRLSADFGNPGAMASLALCFLNGSGVRQNDSAALELASTAARMGDPHAQYLLGRIFDEGLGCPPAPVFGLVYHLRAAKNGVKEAATAVLRLKGALDAASVTQAESLAAQAGFHIDPALAASGKNVPVSTGNKLDAPARPAVR